MIILTRLDGHTIALNEDLLVFAEKTPDTVLTLIDGTKRFDIAVRLAENYRANPAAIAAIPLRTREGALLPFGQVAKIELDEGYSFVRREALQLGISQISAGSRTNPGGYETEAEEGGSQFSLGDHRDLDDVVRDLAGMGFIPSFCTGCYRMGRTGADFMDLAKPGDWRSYPYPFIYGQADATLFDHQNWRACALMALGRKDFEALTADYYTRDDPMLIDYIVRTILPRRGIAARPDEVLLTMGAQNALWMAATILLRPGRMAVQENPCYPGQKVVLQQSGAACTFVDVDADGLPPDRIPIGAHVVFTTASHQSPTNSTMPVARRRALLSRARAQDFVIVEDDYEFEMSFQKASSPALKSLDDEGRVIYVGSFSKSLFPGLRLGYLVGSEPFIREARSLRASVMRHPPGHIQRTCAYFLALGHYDSHLNRLAQSYRRRRQAMAEAITATGLTMAGQSAFGGSSFWMRAPEGVDCDALALRLRQRGVLIEPGGYSSIRLLRRPTTTGWPIPRSRRAASPRASPSSGTRSQTGPKAPRRLALRAARPAGLEQGKRVLPAETDHEDDHRRSLRESVADAWHRQCLRHHRIGLHADFGPVPQGWHHLLGRGARDQRRAPRFDRARHPAFLDRANRCQPDIVAGDVSGVEAGWSFSFLCRAANRQKRRHLPYGEAALHGQKCGQVGSRFHRLRRHAHYPGRSIHSTLQIGRADAALERPEGRHEHGGAAPEREARDRPLHPRRAPPASRPRRWSGRSGRDTGPTGRSAHRSSARPPGRARSGTMPAASCRQQRRRMPSAVRGGRWSYRKPSCRLPGQRGACPVAHTPR